MCVYHVLGRYKGQKRVLETLELELQVVVSCHVPVGNQMWVLERAASVLHSCAISLASL